MSRARFNYPDLDVLDSPLVSPTPISLSGIPGSALAERIFNDPESWEDTDADDSDIPEDVTTEDQFEWLAEEIEKVVGAFHSPSTPTDGKAVDLIPNQISDSPRKSRLSVGRDGAISWKKIGKRASVRPISLAALFEHSGEDFSGEIQQQLSKILESSGIPHHTRPHPHSSALSPPSTSGTSSTLESPLQLSTASTVASSGDDFTPSPVIVNSASATLSFLEWYGIYPDSPLRPKSARIKAPLLKLQVPSPKPAMKPSPLLTPASTTSTVVPPPSRRSSLSGPPPGLEPPPNGPVVTKRNPSPPGLSRSPSPFRASDHRVDQVQRRTESPVRRNVSSERGRALHMTAPPPYSREPSPAAVSRSNSSAGTRLSRDPTPVRGRSQDQPVRRLPSIPSETVSSRPSTPPQPLPQPPIQAEPQVQLQGTPQPPVRVPPRTASPAPSAGVKTSSRQFSMQQVDSRPMSVRSPPMGPRTRSRASQDSTTRVSGPIGHRPPVLRL